MGPDTELARELRRLRVASGLTQEALAQRAGISVRAVSDTERGIRIRLYPNTAERIAAAIGLADADRRAFATLAGDARGRSAGRRVTLPQPRTTLVGRTDDLAALDRLMCDPAIRLVTLIGAGGVGKTRLGLSAAADCAPSFDDGVAFVQLANCSDARSAALAIATAVGANAPKGTAEDLVCESVGTRKILLVCDTFEAALDAAPLVAELLERCPAATVLATSRSPLRLAAERLFVVEPLSVPAARELFAARVADTRPDTDLAGAGRLLDEICERVQRVPLAIELAAARTAHLGLPDLRDRLSSQLTVLTTGPVDDARHWTMEATIAWSYGLLVHEDREALERLAVFDGWNLAAAAYALDVDPLPSVSALVDQSLVSAPPPTAAHGRYRLLDAVREFGLARLGLSGHQGEARERQARWFLNAAEAASAAMRQSGQHSVHHDLEADLGNLRMAFQWFQATDNHGQALRLASSLWMFWLWQGGFSEGRSWLRSALDGAVDANTHLQATARWGAAWLAYHQGDFAEAKVHTKALAALAEANGAAAERRNALTLRGMISLADSRFPESAELLNAARQLAEGSGDPWLLAVSTLNEGIGLTHIGIVNEAAARFAEARGRFADLGDETYVARTLRHLAAVALLKGEPDAARKFLGESSSMVETADDQWGTAETFEGLSHVAAAVGDVRRAGCLASRADALRRSLGVVPHPFDAILAARYLGPIRSTPEFINGWNEETG
ncbi:helix-turn-helix domain-containing protein [bacterium RCC_150]